MKYYLIVGEASGDLHGANLIRSIQQNDDAAQFAFWGGDKMQSTEGRLDRHYKEMSFMGFVEVVANLNTILQSIKHCKNDIDHFKPDVLILIDFSGFNLRIARWAKSKNYTVFYYILPQVWASREGRIHLLNTYTDKRFAILPFEIKFYKKHKVSIDYVGHPLLDVITPEAIESIRNNQKNEHLIALLPGSRNQEISYILPIMLTMVPLYMEYKFIIAQAPSLPVDKYLKYIKKLDSESQSRIEIIPNQMYKILSSAHLAIVTSGTATLEAAIMETPQVVCYKGNSISYHIAKRIINVDYISMVNLILNKNAVTELIQDEFNTARLKKEIDHLLLEDNRNKINKDYQELKKRLGGKGASNRAAKLMFDYIKP